RRKNNFWLPAGGTFGNSLLHKAVNALELDAGDDGADVYGFIERRADAQRVHARLQLARKFFGDAFLDQQARAGAADLSLIEPDTIHQSFDRRVEIGVFKNDERRFAAEFERKF